MPYKIAVASTDGVNIDLAFGSADKFAIYEVASDVYSKLEERSLGEKTENYSTETDKSVYLGNGSGCGSSGGCNTGSGGGCAGSEGTSVKVELISDCRCVVCKKVGFHIQKQLERRAITAFDVDCTIEEALKKISTYFKRVDEHQSLRGISKENM